MLLTEYADQEELGNGVFRQTIAMKKIAVRENGSLLAMNQSWADSGDGTTPHIVNRAPLRSRVANDGMRRLFPIPGDDTSYLEIGAPFVKIGGVWTQVSLGTPSRSVHIMTWSRPQTITRVVHAGHYVKLDIELRGGFVPEDSMIAFPVGIQGLTRTGTQIFKNGVPVMQLRPFVMEDAANLDDVRPITHQFVNLSGNPYLLLTLPSLAGMTRPRIDPTLTLQPNAADGLDTYLNDTSPTTNFGTATQLLIGDPSGAASRATRSLIRFDLSSLPVDATVTSSTLSLREQDAGRAAPGPTTWAAGLRRVLRDWVEAQATWNIYSTSNNWTTAGCGSDGNDRHSSDSASVTLDATSSAAFVDWTSATLADDVQKMRNGTYGNYGWLLQAPTAELQGTTGFSYNDFRPSDHATAGDRPKLAIVYTEAGGGVPKHFMHYQRMAAQ